MKQLQGNARQCGIKGLRERHKQEGFYKLRVGGNGALSCSRWAAWKRWKVSWALKGEKFPDMLINGR